MSFPPREGRKQVLQISNDSRKIKKPPLSLKKAVPAPAPIVRYKYELEPKIINVKTPVDFTYIVQLLTGDPNRPPPKYPCTCDDRPQGILSPAPTSLPPLVSPNDFTPSPSSDRKFCIHDYLEEEWAEASAISLYSVVNPPASASVLPPPPYAPYFRVPPSPFRTMNTEIPPRFNTPLFYPPNHFPPNKN